MSEQTLCIALSILLLLGSTMLHIHLRRQREKEEEAEWAHLDEPEAAADTSAEEEAEPLITDEARRLFFEGFKRWGRPAIDMLPRVEASPLPMGTTKIGGCPDLVPGFEWPTYRDPESGAQNHLAFMAQVNLAEIAEGDTLGELPHAGMLYFFYDMQSERWGFDPEDEGCGRVIYVEDVSALARGSFPEALPEEYRYAERAVGLAPVIIPPHWGDEVESLTGEISEYYVEATPLERLLEDKEKGRLYDMVASLYFTLRAEWRGYEDAYCESRSYLLGYPDNIQGEMPAQCEAVTRKLALGLPYEHEFSEEEEKAMESAGREWVLLFQLASIMDEERGNLMFGDVGNLYFWIRRQDLAAREFSKVWLKLQCY